MSNTPAYRSGYTEASNMIYDSGIEYTRDRIPPEVDGTFRTGWIQAIRDAEEDKEEEVLDDFNNIIYNTFEHSSVASAYYDQVVAEYYRYGEKSAYRMLKQITDDAYNEE